MTTRLDAVVRDLRGIATTADDAIGYFAALYSRVTNRIARAVDDGTFERPEEMVGFAVEFANRYVTPAGTGFTAPRCWKACADVATDPRLLIVQHLLLGINAHVNHDLPLAVVAAAEERGALADVRADFDAVNDVLAAQYTEVLDDLDRVSRWANEVFALGGGRVFNFSLREARRQAWGAAERLWPLDTAARERYRVELDRLVSVVAYLITRPAPAARPILWLARRMEENDARVVTRALLDDDR